MKKSISILMLLAFVSIKSNAQNHKWVSLFDGKTFKNWHTYLQPNVPVNNKWKIENGTIVSVKDAVNEIKVNDLISDKEYENFDLELEWKIEFGGNSGIFFGINEDPKFRTPYMTGPEIQVLDDENHPDAKQGIQDNRKAGSLYDLIPSASKALPSDQWNKVRIKKLHDTVTVWQNEKIAETFKSSGDSWTAMISKSKFVAWPEFGTFKKGHIGLQDHGNTVAFRKIRIMEL